MPSLMVGSRHAMVSKSKQQWEASEGNADRLAGARASTGLSVTMKSSVFILRAIEGFGKL